MPRHTPAEPTPHHPATQPLRAAPHDRFPTPILHAVIASYGRPDLLQRCLDALRRQRDAHLHVILVDDGSPAHVHHRLTDYQHKHADAFDLSLLLNTTNRGANHARNQGVRYALQRIDHHRQTDDNAPAFVALLDNDSIAEPDWTREIVAPFMQPGADDVAAVVGLVRDPDPPNLWTLAYRGTHRVVTTRDAHRIVSCNLCLRSEPLARFGLGGPLSPTATNPDDTPDTAVSGRSDEEGLSIRLRRAGYRFRSAPAAVVLHDHTYDRSSFCRQALRSGRAAARLVHAYRLPHRLDMAPLALAYLLLLPALVLAPLLTPWLILAPTACFTAALAAYLYNDLAPTRKAKAPSEVAKTFHLVLLYYHLRLWGYATQWLKLKRLKKVGPVSDRSK